MISNLKNNLKNKANISSLFNYDSNPSTKTSSTIEDFIDITEEFIDNDVKEKKEMLKKFIKDSISIIFESRKEKINNEFSLNTSKNSEFSNNQFDNNLFNPELDEFFIYNDFYKDKNEVQKFNIEFYLTKKTDNSIIKELVEKWKLTFDLNIRNNEKNIQNFKNKINIYIKSIILYTRLLPLYQFNNSNKDNDDYMIEFKLYQNKSKEKGKFTKNHSGKIEIKNSDLFYFKIGIKYYNSKELENIFGKKDEIDDIYLPNKFRSLSLHKKAFNLKGFESINKITNDNNPINKINNDEKNIKTCSTEINKEKIKEIDSDSDDSSFYLVLDFKEEERKPNIENSNLNKKESTKKSKRKSSFFSNPEETTEDCSPRTSNLKNNFRTSERSNENNISFFSTRKSFIKTENNIINSIIKDYFSLKDKIENLNSSIIIKTDKFLKYAKGCG